MAKPQLFFGITGIMLLLLFLYFHFHILYSRSFKLSCQIQATVGVTQFWGLCAGQWDSYRCKRIKLKLSAALSVTSGALSLRLLLISNFSAYVVIC